MVSELNIYCMLYGHHRPKDISHKSVTTHARKEQAQSFKKSIMLMPYKVQILSETYSKSLGCIKT